MNGSRVYINGSCRIVTNITDYQREALAYCANSNPDYVSFPFSVDENFEWELNYIRDLF